VLCPCAFGRGSRAGGGRSAVCGGGAGDGEARWARRWGYRPAAEVRCLRGVPCGERQAGCPGWPGLRPAGMILTGHVEIGLVSAFFFNNG
jgi:hypothetical protein